MRLKPNGITAEVIGGNILLKMSVPVTYGKQIDSLIGSYKAGREYEVNPYSEKRSLTSNAYLWILCDEIAKVLHGTKEGVYRQAINEVGVFTEMRFASPLAAQKFKKIWQQNGIGWMTKTINPLTVLAYAGSSTYSKQEMARLIDFLVEEAKNLDIDVKPKEEIDALLESWEGR